MFSRGQFHSDSFFSSIAQSGGFHKHKSNHPTWQSLLIFETHTKKYMHPSPKILDSLTEDVISRCEVRREATTTNFLWLYVWNSWNYRFFVKRNSNNILSNTLLKIVLYTFSGLYTFWCIQSILAEASAEVSCFWNFIVWSSFFFVSMSHLNRVQNYLSSSSRIIRIRVSRNILLTILAFSY